MSLARFADVQKPAAMFDGSTAEDFEAEQPATLSVEILFPPVRSVVGALSLARLLACFWACWLTRLVRSEGSLSLLLSGTRFYRKGKLQVSVAVNCFHGSLSCPRWLKTIPNKHFLISKFMGNFSTNHPRTSQAHLPPPVVLDLSEPALPVMAIAVWEVSIVATNIMGPAIQKKKMAQ